MSTPLPEVYERGPAHVLGSPGDGLTYAFWVSETGTQVFGHKQLSALRGLLNHPTAAIDLGPHYLGCQFGDFVCRRLLDMPTQSIDAVSLLGARILDACKSLHQQRLFHGCLSPARIVLSDTLDLVIRDCGVIAAILMHLPHKLTIQTPGFDRIFGPNDTIPPEILLGHPCSSETDIFLIGSILYPLLTGRDPFETRTTLARYHRMSTGAYARLGPEYGELGTWINRSLEPRVSQRPSLEESRTLLQTLGQSSSIPPLFCSTTAMFSETLSHRETSGPAKPILASDQERSSAVASLEGRIRARPRVHSAQRPSSRWGTWLALLSIVGLTWIFIELSNSEMRTRRYDGRPGPTRQQSPSVHQEEVDLKPGKTSRRRAERSSRLPRRAITH